MKCLVLLLAISQFQGTALAAPDIDPVATQRERKDPHSGYTAWEAFPHLEIVRKGVIDRALADRIEDARVREYVDQGSFYTLDVRNLALRLGDMATDTSALRIPYAVSVKHSQGSEHWYNASQGTINVAGELRVTFEGPKLKVTVLRFDDSWWLESLGRTLGFNRRIDAAFARAVVVPELEQWFNAEPERAQKLLNLVQVTGPAKP